MHVAAMIDLGSSDAPAVLGVSPHTTPWQLWARKLGLLPAEIEDTEVMKRGRQLEIPVINMFIGEALSLYPEGLGLEDAILSPNTTRWDGARPALRATPDALLVTRDGPQLVEVKCVVGYPPDTPRVEWIVQCLHQRMVYPEATHHYLVCFGNLKLVWWDVPYHQRAMDRLLREEERFLERIETRDAPPVRAADAAVLGKAWRITSTEPIDLDAYREIAATYDAACERLAVIQNEKNALEAVLKQAMGAHEEAAFSDGSKLTWRPHTRKGYTVADSVVRRFDRRAPKGESNGGHD
jgi:predicted phage-related endonuclease